MSYLELIAKVGGGEDVVGGRAGVSKASGFIMRMMAENKVKHNGQYRKPTTLPPGSKMSAPAIFDYKKLASPEQGGLNRAGNPYGASPFITKHFEGDYVPFSARPYPAETQAQRVARYRFMARRLEKLARQLAGQPPQAEQRPPLEHFGNVIPTTMEGLEIRRREPEPEVAPPPPREEPVVRNEIVRPPPPEEEEEEEVVKWSIPKSKLNLYSWEDMTEQEAQKWKKKQLIAEFLASQAWRIDDVKPREVAEYLRTHDWKTGLDSSALSKGMKEVIEDIKDDDEYQRLEEKYGEEARAERKHIKEKFKDIINKPGVSEGVKKIQNLFKKRGTEERRAKSDREYERKLEKLNKLAIEHLRRSIAYLKKQMDAEYRQGLTRLKPYYKWFYANMKREMNESLSRTRYKDKGYYTEEAVFTKVREEIHSYLRSCIREKNKKKIEETKVYIREKYPKEVLNAGWKEWEDEVFDDLYPEKVPDIPASELKTDLSDVSDAESVVCANHMVDAWSDDEDFINILDSDYKEQIANAVRKEEEGVETSRREAKELEDLLKGKSFEEASQLRTSWFFKNGSDIARPKWWAKITALREYMRDVGIDPDSKKYFGFKPIRTAFEEGLYDSAMDDDSEIPNTHPEEYNKFMFSKKTIAKMNPQGYDEDKVIREAIAKVKSEVAEFSKLLSRKGYSEYPEGNPKTKEYRIMYAGDLLPIWKEWDEEVKKEKNVRLGEYPVEYWNKTEYPKNHPIELEEVPNPQTRESIPARPERPATGKKSREDRLIEVMKEKPGMGLVELSGILKKEGYSGVSPSNLSIIKDKQLIPKGLWKIKEWSAEAVARRNTGSGSYMLKQCGI
jgi:hypothetical protein